MIGFHDDVGAATEAYAAYVNAPRGALDPDEQQLFDQDLVRARAADGAGLARGQARARAELAESV